MSTIVYLTPPAYGHVNPTLPVMQELTRRGDRVICYNTEEFRPQIERTGAIFRPYPPNAISHSEISRLVEDGNLANVTCLIFRATRQILPFLLEEFSRDRPDLVIFDTIALWGKMAATQLHLRAAASIGVFVMDERQIRYRDLLPMLGSVLPHVPTILAERRRLIKHYGKAFPAESPLFPMRAGLNIIYTTQALQPATPLIDKTFRFVGPSIDPQTRDHHFPFDLLGQNPLVYISLGTVHTNQTAFFRTCFAAFANYPARFIVSAGKEVDIDALGPIPANFIVQPVVPQLEILQHADVFISHGGMNSIHEALYYGVPLVVVPHQSEQLLNGRCITAQGAGLLIDNVIRKTPITAIILRQSLDRILTDCRYRDTANQLKHALRATGGYRQAADEIQTYIATAEPA